MTKTKKQKRSAVYEVSAVEIARTLGITPQRVYQLEAKALRKIRKGLADRGYGAEINDLPRWIIEYILKAALSE